MFINSIVLYSH